MKWTRQAALIAGVALIATTNLVALGGAAYNRAGEPDSVLSLNQRELQPPYASARESENSGLTLRLRWRVLPLQEPKNVYAFDGEGGGAATWLDAAKMAELGFEPISPEQPENRRDRQLSKEVFVALELSGPAHQQALQRARRAAAAVEAKDENGQGRKDAQEIIDTEHRRSRLFAVDAGLDRDALRAKYPDRRAYAIVRGRVRPAWHLSAGGTIDDLSVDELSVPLEMRAAFEGASSARHRRAAAEDQPRFEAEVAFGRRLEPWLVAAARK